MNDEIAQTPLKFVLARRQLAGNLSICSGKIHQSSSGKIDEDALQKSNHNRIPKV